MKVCEGLGGADLLNQRGRGGTDLVNQRGRGGTDFENQPGRGGTDLVNQRGLVMDGGKQFVLQIEKLFAYFIYHS